LFLLSSEYKKASVFNLRFMGFAEYFFDFSGYCGLQGLEGYDKKNQSGVHGDSLKGWFLVPVLFTYGLY